MLCLVCSVLMISMKKCLMMVLQGTGYIYESVLRPYVSKHENEIDRKLSEWKARGWDYVIFYWQYCAKFGQTAFVQALHHLASQSSKFSSNPNSEVKSRVD